MHSSNPLQDSEKSSRYAISTEWHGRWPTAVGAPEHGCVSVARSALELEEIGALRYELYVERDHKLYDEVDHVSRNFLEPIDAVSLNFQSRLDGRLLASVRGVRAEDAMHDKHLKLLLDAPDVHEMASTVVCSRLIVRPENRARACVKPMFEHVYRLGLAAGARTCVLGTRADLVGIFERFGFRATGRHVRDPVANDIHVMMIDMHDLAYMKKIGSPLTEPAERFLESYQNVKVMASA